MADSVNRILESQLPNLEELLHVGVFSEHEIRTIIRRRRRLEYGLFTNPPKLYNFLLAIEYEMNLDKLRRHRKESLGIGPTSGDGEFGVANRIHGLFRRALKHFKANIRLWFQYIQFCQQMNQENELSNVFGRALAIHPTEPALWILAAKFEFESRKDATAARTIFQQGIKANPHLQQLWIEYFRLELLYAEKLIKRKGMLRLADDEDSDEKLTDEILQLKLPIIVFSHAVKSIPGDIIFRLKFIEVCRLFQGASNIQDVIYDSIQRDFHEQGLCWDSLAKRCWTDKVQEDYMLQTKEAYMKGMKHVKGKHEQQLLWKLYCQWVVDHTGAGESQLEELFLLSCEKDLITEELCLLLFKRMLQLGLIDTVSPLIESVLATSIPESCELWLINLQLKEPSLDFELFNTLCKEALDEMNTIEQRLCIYHYWIDVLLLRQQDVTFLLEKATADTRHESIIVRMLECSFINGGIKAVRKFFKSLEQLKPLSCTVYLKYFDLEQIEGSPPKQRIMDEALQLYGDISIDVWLKCINAELLHNSNTSGTTGDNPRLTTLHWRANNTIKDKLALEEFNQCYNKLI